MGGGVISTCREQWVPEGEGGRGGGVGEGGEGGHQHMVGV